MAPAAIAAAGSECLHAHDRCLTRAEVLARHWTHRKAQSDDGKEAGLDDTHADAEARLRRGAERPADHVDEHEIHRHERELCAGGQADLQHVAPEIESRRPVAEREAQIRVGGQEVHDHPDHADGDGDERRDGSARDTQRRCPCPSRRCSTGASTMLRMTVAVCTTMPGRKLPVPRSADAIAIRPNCSASAGMNHNRYSAARLQGRCVGAEASA